MEQGIRIKVLKTFSSHPDLRKSISHIEIIPPYDILYLEQYYLESPMTAKMLRPDAKGRITLGSIARGISGYSMSQESNGVLILKPFIEIPVKEKWLFENATALQKVKTGLTQAKNKELIDKGCFSQFSDDEVE
jgi:hypothetical protein